MLLKCFKLSLALAAASCLAACDMKDSDRCKCVDETGEPNYVNVDDQECSDLSTDRLTCYPAD